MGVQAYAAVFFAAPCSVFKIPLNVQAEPFKLCPYLVVPTGNKLNFHKQIVTAFADKAITQNRFFPTRPWLVMGDRLVSP